MLWNDTIPTYTFTDEKSNKTLVQIIAGKIDAIKAPNPAPDSWASDPDHEVAIWTIKMAPGAQWRLPVASVGVNRSLYFYSGDSIQVADKNFTSHQAIELYADQNVTLHNGSKESYLLLLQGKPISEPIAQHGPFVMNTQAEINEAMMEYQLTEFGGWPWPSHEHVHARDKKRFAKYPDGTEEVKD